MRKPQLRVAVCGGIAVGKTSLATQLGASVPDSQVLFEHPENNPYLADFYSDMHQWAFHSRIAMLALFASRFGQFDAEKSIIIMDRCLQELITFADLQHNTGNMSGRDYTVYRSLYEALAANSPVNDLVLYLECSAQESLRRARARGRTFESNLTLDYVNEVNLYYELWLDSLPLKTKVIRYNTEAGIDLERLVSEILVCSTP
jgi:deoxyadenosine/deoxycytidine kinase